jgi:tetratricopeptide (TPR) repeat protein
MTKKSRSILKLKESGPPSDKNPTAARIARTPLWQALLIPVVAILIFFLLLEGGLSLLGVRPAIMTEDPFVGFASNVPLFVSQPGPGGSQLLTTATNKLDLFNQQSFPKVKAANSYRIFTLGGSTTYGRPYFDLTSFSGWLREMLPAADNGKNWEVINAGGISYASYRVAHLMEELVKYQPDLFIIYTGQNEFLEERTYSQIKEIQPLVRSAVSLLAKTRTWTMMNNALQTVGLAAQKKAENTEKLGVTVNAILDQSVGINRYTRDESLQKKVLLHYRISLERMVALARSVGAQVIFVNPASSLNDCTPFKSEHTAGLAPVERQRTTDLLEKAKFALKQEAWGEAVALLKNALAADPGHAEMHYRLGQALLALGHFDEAKKEFILARDEDVCPLRALSSMNTILFEVAEEQNVEVVDFVALVDQQMQKLKGHSIPGEELFLDHVHPTIEGHRILALALIQNMIKLELVQPQPDWGEGRIEEVKQKVESKISRETHGQSLANLARVLIWAGKREDAARLARKAQEIAGEYRQVAVDSASILSTVYALDNQPERALELLYATLEKAPGAVEIRLKLAQTQLGQGPSVLEKAAANLLLVCQQMPDFDQAFELFGVAMSKRGRLDIAYSYLTEALRLNPKNKAAQVLLAKIQPFLKVGKTDPNPPFILLDISPTRAPRKLVQLRPDASGRNIIDGIEVEFFENGRIERYMDYVNGQRHGVEMVWNPDGTLISQVFYKEGVPLK